MVEGMWATLDSGILTLERGSGCMGLYELFGSTLVVGVALKWLCEGWM